MTKKKLLQVALKRKDTEEIEEGAANLAAANEISLCCSSSSFLRTKGEQKKTALCLWTACFAVLPSGFGRSLVKHRCGA